MVGYSTLGKYFGRRPVIKNVKNRLNFRREGLVHPFEQILPSITINEPPQVRSPKNKLTKLVGTKSENRSFVMP